MQEKKTVRVYALGGAGLNLARELSAFPREEEGFARLELAHVDTSRSNLTEDVPENEVYVLKDLDGLGKIRREGAEAISQAALDILQKFKPADFNIVISSASGGTGSVATPSLLRHLLDKEQNVVVVMIGSTDTHLEAQNTLNSLKSLEGVSKLTNKPVVLHYQENSPETPRLSINKHVVNLVNDLRALFSGQNRELDTRDLHNWLRFDRSTAHRPQVASLTEVAGQQSLPEDLGNVISVASLSSSEAVDARLGAYVEYRCNGYISPELSKVLGEQDPLHYVISDGPIAATAKRLSRLIEELEAQRASRVQSTGLLSQADQPNQDGLVF